MLGKRSDRSRQEKKQNEERDSDGNKKEARNKGKWKNLTEFGKGTRSSGQSLSPLIRRYEMDLIEK
jgi:hypothetical protein